MNRSHGAARAPSFRPSHLNLRSLATRVPAAIWSRRIVLLLLLGLLVWISTLQLTTPAVQPATAPETAFSAERAMAHLRVIAAEPHPVGSTANAAVRQYLIDTIRAMGLEPGVQTTSSLVSEGHEGFRAGTVNNVFVRVSGTESTGLIAINAHYDSVNTAPGASDAGSGVVTALESLRAILAGAPLKNDLLFVFVDGEERHMLGSAAFTEQHPWGQEARLTLNYEAQGGGGPAFLYVTSKDNDWLVKEFLTVAPDPSAYSLIATISNIYTEGRFDSDLGEYIQQGSQGLGFLYAGDTPSYHSVLDNVSRIDPGSIQQEGGYTVALVRRFGDRDLTEMPRSGDRVFFNALSGVVIHYADRWVIPFAAMTTVVIAGLVVLGFRRKELTAGGLAVGTLASLLSIITAVVLVTVLWAAIRMLNPDFQVQMVGFYHVVLLVVMLIAATVAIMATIYTLLGLKVRRQNLVAGVLLGSLPALWFLSIAAPGTSYLVTWPLLFAALPLAWTLLARGHMAHPWAMVAVLAIAAVPAIMLLPGTLYQMAALAQRFEGTIGLPVLGLTMLFVAPIVALFVPHLRFFVGDSPRRRGRWAVPAAAVLVTVMLIGWATATSGFDAAHPRPDNIAYKLDADTGAARWVSYDVQLDGWTQQFFPDGVQKVDDDTLVHGTVPAFIADALAIPLALPEVTVLGDSIDGEVRTLHLRLSSPRGVTEMTTAVTAPGEIVAAAIDGRSVDLSDYAPARDGEFSVIYADVLDDGWELILSVRSAATVTVEIEEATDGLPGVPGTTIAPRPADTMPSLLYPRDATIVTRTVRI